MNAIEITWIVGSIVLFILGVIFGEKKDELAILYFSLIWPGILVVLILIGINNLIWFFIKKLVKVWKK